MLVTGLPNGFDIIGNTLTVSENSLDFEGIRSYRFNVTASDGGNPELSSVAPVEIMIEDLNDNSPSFSATTYYADLNEGNYTANSTSIVLVCCFLTIVIHKQIYIVIFHR